MTTATPEKATAAAAAASYELNPTELAEALTLMVGIQQPTFVWGPPGIGKSDIARQVAAALEMRHHDIRAPLYDPVDLRGLPYMDKDPETGAASTQWAPPTFLPPTDSPEQHLIVFDELPTAPPMVQNALYQLILDRRCGEYELPPGATMIACGNRETDRGATYSMPTPLASRFVHLHLAPSLEQWTGWAVKNKIAYEILFFLRFNPDKFHAFDARQKKDQAFPCPRTWAFVSNVIKSKNGLPLNIERNIYAGAIGQGAAVEFSAFMEHFRELPDPQAIFDDPENAVIPPTTDAQIALAAALCRYVTDVTFPALMTYVNRLPSFEIAQYLVDSCLRKDENLRYTHAWIQWETAKHQ